MTTYIMKMPLAIGMMFFAVAGLSAVVNGAGIISAILRGALAGSVSMIFAGLLAYAVFYQKIPEAEVPADIEVRLKGKFRRQTKNPFK